jgi:RNA polymerase sigma-70 factor (ECF subfamily)
MTALQYLPPRQRAVLILRDVLDFSANETAEVLEITVSSANSALHRARTTLTQRYQGHEAGYTTLSPGDEKTQLLLDQFVRAWETADVDGLVALLKEDAVLSMPPSPSWYQGRDAIHAFVTLTVFGEEGMFGGKADGRWQLVETRANSSPAFALYQRIEANEYRALGLHVLEYEGGSITKIVSFIDPSLPSRFGLPSVLKR